MDGDGVVVGVNNAKFSGKRVFRKLLVDNKKGEEAEGEKKKGGGAHPRSGLRGGRTYSLTMDTDF